MNTAQRGILLFAHGSRDPEWAKPIEAIAARLRIAQPALPCALGYLEAAPGFEEAVQSLQGQGVTAVEIVPLFLARGAHLRRDLPPLVEAASRRYGMTMRLRPALGEDETMVSAIVDWIVGRGD